MSNRVVKKINDQVITMESTEEMENAIKETYHMCWDCVNARADKCAKVQDESKKNIADYDFIRSGYQIIDDKNEVDTFIVTGCKNFVKDIERKHTAEEKKHLEEIKKSIMTNYYGTETYDEAIAIQKRELLSKSDTNKYTEIKGRSPFTRMMEEMRGNRRRKGK